MSGQHVVSKWIVTATGSQATAAATRGAESGKAHYVTGIAASFSVTQAVGKLLTLLDGATVVGNYHVLETRDVVINKPIRITAGNLVTISLPAANGGGEIGAVVLTGYTVG